MIKFSKKLIEFIPNSRTPYEKWKYCIEYSYLVCLRYFFYESPNSISHQDSPDLLINNCIGVEVVQSQENKYMQNIGTWIKFLNHPNSRNEHFASRVIEDNGGKMYEGMIVHAPIDFIDEKETIKEIIVKKHNKLPTYNKNLSNIYLAIYIESDFDDLITFAIEFINNEPINYDGYYFLLFNKIVFYDTNTKILDSRNISKEEYNCIQNSGVMIVNGFLNSIEDCFEYD